MITNACSPNPIIPTIAPLATVPNRSTAVLSQPTLPPTYAPFPAPTVQPTPTPQLKPTPCAESGHIIRAEYPNPLTGSLAYRIYLPPCYQETERVYPTLYMLPGNNQTDAIWDELGIDETAGIGIKSGAIPPLIIVMPDGGWSALNTSGGPGSYETVILDLIPFIEEAYCVWPVPAGRAIGGLSRGGYWALEIAFRNPSLFTSVGGHSASLLDIAAGENINPQFTGLANALGDLRIYLDIGENDGGLPNTQKLHEDLVANDIPHTWMLNEGGHENEYWSAHLLEYLEWYSTPWLMPKSKYPPCERK